MTESHNLWTEDREQSIEGDSELLAAAREELGDDVFQADWETGRSLTEEGAIAAALED